MSKLCVIFLILSGCITIAPITFDAEWVFLKDKDGQTMACLPKEDVKKLRETLIRCDNGPE